MKTFIDDQGADWTATAREEDVPRHHGRWYLVLVPAGGDGAELALPEIRWQNRQTAERSIRTMSEFELRRRVRMASRRGERPGDLRDPFGAQGGAAPGAVGGAGTGGG